MGSRNRSPLVSVTDMRNRPEDLDESELRHALCAWQIDAVSLTYAPVGFGDHHWTAVDAGGRRWFVTVADLENKSQCGQGTESALNGLCRAMDTASALNQAGLGFVVAPLPTVHGQTVRRLEPHHAVSVFPFVDGGVGRFGQTFDPTERDLILDMLARVHRMAPPVSVRLLGPELPARARLDDALTDLGRPWLDGPYAEPARALVADHAAGLRRRLAELDQCATQICQRNREVVVTHGEPHPGNVLRGREGYHLVDWDTVGLAVPERDLWLVAEEPDDLARYTEATGRAPDPGALAFYRLRWALDDVASFVDQFRSPHDRTADTELAWTSLTETMELLTSDGPGGPTSTSRYPEVSSTEGGPGSHHHGGL